MSKPLTNLNYTQPDGHSLEDYFIATGFYDLLPMALELAGRLGHEECDMIEAIGKVSDGDILAHRLG